MLFKCLFINYNKWEIKARPSEEEKINRKNSSDMEVNMKRSYYKYLSALLLFGSNGIVASFIALSSYEIVLLRTLIGSLLLIVLFPLGGKKLSFFKYKRDSLFLTVSGIAMGASWMLLYEAYVRIGVSDRFGILCGLLSAVMYAFMVIFNKKAQNITGLENATLQLFVSFLTVAVCGYLEPLSAVLFSVLFLKEKMLPLQFMGAILILGGALFSEKC